MQRTPLKRVPMKRKLSTMARKPLKRHLEGAKNRKKTTDLAKLKKQLWELCKQITRTSYGNICYTCAAYPLAGGNWHTGHFVASSICGAYLRYDLRNLRPQCYRCNVSLVGNGAVFYRNMVEREGQAYVDGIFADKERETKMTKAFLSEKIESYTQVLAGLEEKGVS